MSPDARNSILLWVGALVCFGLGWAALQIDTPERTPWLSGLFTLIGGVNLARFFFGIWQRRASNPSRPNRP